MTIALVTMVKNEEKTLPRLLASVKGFADKIIAFDTGSTDSTHQILKDAGADILTGEFKDFGTSRTELMKFAKGKADWLLLMDADQTLEMKPPLLMDPNIASYLAESLAGTRKYWVPRLVRGDRDWVYVGATHEYLAGTEGSIKLPGLFVKHHNDGGCQADK